MPDPEELNPNPIVAMAMRIRARRDVEAAVDAALPTGSASAGDTAVEAQNADASLGAFAEELRSGAIRLNAILGRNAVTVVRLERPLRVRLRFGDERIALDLDRKRQLVIVRGLGLDGEYQFDASSAAPALINLSKLSTEPGYGDALTPSVLLKTIAAGAELARPAHLDALGPIVPPPE